MPRFASAVLEETAKLHAGDAENLGIWQRDSAALPGGDRRDLSPLGRHVRRHARRELLPRSPRRGRRRPAERGIAQQSEGAVCVFLEGQPAPMLIQKQDGAYLYATTDLATIQYRMEQLVAGCDPVRRRSPPEPALQAALRRRAALGLPATSSWRTLLRHRAGGRWPTLQDAIGRHRRPVRPAGRGGEPGLRDRLPQRRCEARGRGARRGGPPADRLSGRHRRAQVRRPLPEPHQRLHLQLRQDAGHERQHGDVHAVRLRPRAEHLCQGQRRCPALAATAARSCSRIPWSEPWG